MVVKFTIDKKVYKKRPSPEKTKISKNNNNMLHTLSVIAIKYTPKTKLLFLTEEQLVQYQLLKTVIFNHFSVKNNSY